MFLPGNSFRLLMLPFTNLSNSHSYGFSILPLLHRTHLRAARFGSQGSWLIPTWALQPWDTVNTIFGIAP
jgi:hypothetical protein